MKHNTITIYIDFDEVLNYVYAQSAWHANMLLLKLKEGYADIRQRVMGYLTFDNYNPNIESRNIMMTFEFRHKQPSSFGEALHDTLVALLANFMLMRFYGEIDPRGTQYGSSIFYIEWRRYKSKLLLAFAHDEM